MRTTGKILLIGTITYLTISCGNRKIKSEINENEICVKVEVMTETSFNLPVHCSGILTSKCINKLSFKTGGLISKIFVEESAPVKKGQLLASLDMTEITAQVQQTRIALDKAERDLKRVKNLYADTVATLQQMQDITSAYEATLENKNIAEFNQRYSQIIAPDNGRIIAKLAEENELIGPGMPVLVFSKQGKDEWIVKTGVSDKDIVNLKKGDSTEVEFDAYNGKTFSASISRTAETADPSSGTFEIEIAVNPKAEKFITGLVAKITIKPSVFKKVTIIPPEALTGLDDKKGFVFIADTANSTAHKIPVTIAYVCNKGIAVYESLNKIGPVITKGAAYLEEGSKIKIQ